MTVQSWLEKQERVDEPENAEEYGKLITKLATERRLVIIRHKGKELAAFIPVDLLEKVREMWVELDQLREKWVDVERQAAQIDMDRVRRVPRPPQSWFDDTTDDPFTPEGKPK